MVIYDLTDTQRYPSRYSCVIHGLWGLIVTNTHNIVYFGLIINVMWSSNILSLVYPLSLFFYALIKSPQPNRRYFNFLWGYTTFLLCIKFLYQFPVFCECPTDRNPYRFGNDSCADCPQYSQTITFTIPKLIGIYKFLQQGQSSAPQAYIKGVACDVLLIVLLHFNKRNMKISLLPFGVKLFR
eukprot:TRINITY_DN16056_c0_g1_i1.p1 TRINITY_DN16056_c0_g1~~TRINITY_DN16056_c0_g1_i1.p1  ORF type:complete len:183 (-),score=17.26 TRINITY_DN16056_c0_g1_i1:32-580(-)